MGLSSNYADGGLERMARQEQKLQMVEEVMVERTDEAASIWLHAELDADADNGMQMQTTT
ncbi:hypothetical protein KFK09_021143 [Dendrobium nobile]|uniref:Uncharacterized protein n=1 Tax=Dendrobium nobile TaxID=94219 RepID=A0A8T3AV08_DENNO|nr:hypothetical protein KFK09_021143 [Dendrobium nobile]